MANVTISVNVTAGGDVDAAVVSELRVRAAALTEALRAAGLTPRVTFWPPAEERTPA